MLTWPTLPKKKVRVMTVGIRLARRYTTSTYPATRAELGGFLRRAVRFLKEFGTDDELRFVSDQIENFYLTVPTKGWVERADGIGGNIRYYHPGAMRSALRTLIDVVRRVEHTLPTAADGTATQAPAREATLVPVMPVSSWDELQIVFISDERIQVYIKGNAVATFNYTEFGLEDRRSKKPNGAWMMLLILAKLDRPLNQNNAGGAPWTAVEKRIQEIRAHFKTIFGRTDDPILYTEGIGYQPRFEIRLGPAYHH